MKKFVLFVMVNMMILLSIGCRSLRVDPNHAIAEITTSTGEAYIVESVNGAGYTRASVDYALDKKYKKEFKIADGETVTIHFYCNSCGYDETETVEAPYAKMFHCECPEEINEEGNAREYMSVTVSKVIDK